MALLQLPLDVLDRIVQATLPEGFEGMVLTCKALNQVGSRFLDKYNTSRRTWRHVNLTDQISEVHPISGLLLGMAENPTIGRYIQYASFWSEREYDEGCSELPHQDELDRLWERLCTQMQIDAVDLKSHELMPANEAADSAYWRQQELSALRFLRTTITLLTMLPNIQTLSLPKEWKGCNRQTDENENWWNFANKDIWGVLDQLVSTSNEDPSRRPFSNLHRLSYIASAGYDNVGSTLGFRCLMPFLAMPQITELYASSLILVDDGYTGIPFGDWRYPQYESNLRKIELASCCMDASISTFLPHVPSLQIFKYSHECKWHGCEYEWSAGEFVAAVGRCCGSTLVELAVTIDDDTIGSIVTGVTSFQEYKKLQHLELDMRVFLGPAIESGERVSHMDEFEQIQWKVEQIPPLRKMLPPSIQTLTLVSLIDAQNQEVFEHLFLEFDESRATALPSLRSVVLEQEQGFNEVTTSVVEEIGRRCEKSGIECRTMESAHAPWRRDFGSRFPRVEELCNGCQSTQ